MYAKFILKVGLTTEGWLNARAGWTTQGSRILLSTTTLTPDPVPGGTGRPSVPRGHTPIHIGGLITPRATSLKTSALRPL